MGKPCLRVAIAGGIAVLAAAAIATAATGTARQSASGGVTAGAATMPARAQGHSLLAGLPPASLGGPCLRSGAGFLRARIRGAVRLDVNLRGQGLTCEGGPRSNGSGIRMAFEGRVGSAGRVRMIFGIEGAKKGRAGRELPTNLTVFFEDEKLLFATQGDGNCTVDRLTQEPVSANSAPTRPRGAVAKMRAQVRSSAARRGKPNVYRVVAHGFCIAPANDLSGRRRIVVTTFDFAGRADFDTP